MNDILSKIMEKVTKSKTEIENDPSRLKNTFLELDKELGVIQSDAHSAQRSEKYKFEIEFSDMQLLRFKHIMMIYKTIFNLTEEEVVFYLINQGIFLKMYELGLLRQKIMDISGEPIENENDLSFEIGE